MKLLMAILAIVFVGCATTHDPRETAVVLHTANQQLEKAKCQYLYYDALEDCIWSWCTRDGERNMRMYDLEGLRERYRGERKNQ